MAIVWRKRSKMLNIKVPLDGYVFDSQKEADRYTQLKLMERSGEIRGLCVHPHFDLEVNGQLICVCTPDFSYVGSTGELVVEDVKGKGKFVKIGISRKRRRFSTRTAVYQLKKKLMKAIRGIEIREI